MAYKFNPFTGTFDEVGSGSPDLSGYVPYTGATGNVDLGANTLIAADLQTTLVSSASFNYLENLSQNVQDTLNNLANNFSSYVPYTGASTNVDLGTNTIAAANLSGTNTGDQTSIVGISGTMSQFNTAVSDGNILFNDEQGLGFRFENRTSDPGTPAIGQVWLRTDL